MKLVRIGVLALSLVVMGCSSTVVKGEDQGKDTSKDVVEEKGGDVTGELQEVSKELPEDSIGGQDTAADLAEDEGKDSLEVQDVPEDMAGDEGIVEVQEDTEVVDTGKDEGKEVPQDTAEETVEEVGSEVEVQEPKRTGECHSSSDCGGHECQELTIGWHVCLQDMPQEFTECKPPKTEMDECCSSKDCDEGAGCYKTYPINFYGGPAPGEPFKICIADECHEDSDCQRKSSDDQGMVPGLCLPPGVNGWPKTRCVTNYCERFGGCGEGEYCRLMKAPCANVYYGAFCASPKTCETDADCPQGQQCVGDTKTGKTVCKTVYCPA